MNGVHLTVTPLTNLDQDSVILGHGFRGMVLF
jgi:hypothetical protein